MNIKDIDQLKYHFVPRGGGPINGAIKAPYSSALTISSGAVTVTGNLHTIDTEGSAVYDELTTIDGGSLGYELSLKLASGSRLVMIKRRLSSGNIQTSTGQDILLCNTSQVVKLVYDGTYWNAQDYSMLPAREQVASLNYLGFLTPTTDFNPSPPFYRYTPSGYNFQFNTAMCPGWMLMRVYNAAGQPKLYWKQNTSTSFHRCNIDLCPTVAPMQSAADYLWAELRGYAVETPDASSPFVALQFQWLPVTRANVPFNVRFVRGTGITYNFTDATAGVIDQAGSQRLPIVPGQEMVFTIYNNGNYIGYEMKSPHIPYPASYYTASYGTWAGYFKRFEFVIPDYVGAYHDVLIRSMWAS